jgi:CheY-like chemotaxis protein
MPGMDGYETCRRLRAAPSGDVLFIIALTGWGQDEDKRRAQEAGFDLHLVKPISRDALLQALTAARDRVDVHPG